MGRGKRLSRQKAAEKIFNRATWRTVEVDSSVLRSEGEGLYGLLGFEEADGSEYSKMFSRPSNGAHDIQIEDPKGEDDHESKQKIESKIESEVEKGMVSVKIASDKKKRRNKKDKPANQSNAQNDSVPDKGKSKSIRELSDGDLKTMLEWTQYNVHNDLIKSLFELGFVSPTLIQSKCFDPAMRDRKCIVAAAETGSGKTLAFGIPILDRLLRQKPTESLQALILSPTRELALQIVNHIKDAAKHTSIQTVPVVGGMALQKQRRLLSRKPEIVVATPGRLWELIEEGNEHLSDMSSIQFLVIDEADRMINTGRYEELDKAVNHLHRTLKKPKSLQTFLFSATMSLVGDGRSGDAVISKLLKRVQFQKKPEFIDVTNAQQVAGSLSECRVDCTKDDKDDYVYYFLSRYKGRTLIFCNTIASVRRLHGLFSVLEVPVYPLHASMQQRQRLKNLDRFRNSEHCVLICTDVAARGLDIPLVQHVIHYQLPKTSDIYVHRSGRTARAGDDGFSLALVAPEDLRAYKRICRVLRRPNGITAFPVQTSLLTTIRKRVNIARKLDRELCDMKRKNAEAKWFENAAEELDMILDEDLVSKNDTSLEQRERDEKIEKLRQSLHEELGRPVMPRRVGRSVVSTNKEVYGTMNFKDDVEKNAIVEMQQKVRVYAVSSTKATHKKRKSADVLKSIRRMKSQKTHLADQK